MSVNLKKLEMTLVDNRYNQSGVIDNKEGLALVAELREARKRIAELEAENAKLRADAGRYQWLRDVGDAAWEPMSKRVREGAAGIDAAIDAARKEQQ